MSCKPKAEKLLLYQLNIRQQTLNVDGSRMIDNVKEDTVMATNDTNAFDRGLLKYLAIRSVEDRLNNRISISDKFVVMDSLGLNVRNGLSQHTVDSLEDKYIQLRPVFAKYLHKK